MLKLNEEMKKKLAKIEKELGHIEVFGKLAEDKINHFTPPYAVRNDCSVGQWKVGNDGFLGNELNIIVLDVQPFYGDLGQTKSERWFQLWFLPALGEDKLPINTVCVTYLKTQSGSLFYSDFIDLQSYVDPIKVVWTGNFKQDKNEYGTYYYVSFTPRFAEEKEFKYIELAANFIKENKQFLIDTNLPDTMLPLSDTSDPIALAEAHKQLKALRAENQNNKELTNSNSN